ncbi:hypothetical protein P692DRAFT_20933884, partial [Suillus brevipes Sb2]
QICFFSRPRYLIYYRFITFAFVAGLDFVRRSVCAVCAIRNPSIVSFSPLMDICNSKCDRYRDIVQKCVMLHCSLQFSSPFSRFNDFLNVHRTKCFNKQTVLRMHTNETDNLLCLEATMVSTSVTLYNHTSVIASACPRQTLPRLRNIDSFGALSPLCPSAFRTL